MRAFGLFLLLSVFGCAAAEEVDVAGGGDAANDSGATDDTSAIDDASDDTFSSDTGASDDDSGDVDSGVPESGDVDSGAIDSGVKDTAVGDTGVADTGMKDTGVTDTAPSGPITGGPCVSGAAGATAVRLRFYNGGGKATLAYDVWGLPDKSRQKAGVYGYTIPYSTPAWADPYLGEGGLPLDSSNFIDIELSTIGLSSIKSVTLSLYGRSYATSTSGSFNWQTFKGTGATATSSMSNAPPYRWYPGNATAVFTAGDGGARLRIKAGPASGSVVVNKLELCMEAS